MYLPKHATDNQAEDEKPVCVEVYDCPDKICMPELKYPTPILTDDMIEQNCDYLCWSQCEVIVDELKRMMEVETCENYDCIATEYSAFGMSLNEMGTGTGYG